MDNRICENSIINLDKKESMVLAYYLFELSKGSANNVIFERDVFLSMVEQLVTSLSLENRFREVMKAYISDLLENEKLTNFDLEEEIPVPDDDSTRSHILYERKKRLQKTCDYKEDESISRIKDFETFTEDEKDFYRILYTANEGVFPQLIYNTFFTSGKINIFKIQREIPERWVKNALDVSRLNFMVKELGLTNNEAKYLMFRYRKSTIDSLDEICNILTKNSNELYTKLLKINKSDFLKVVRPDQKLRQFGFISDERSLNPAVLECIEAQDLSLYFADCIKPVDLSSTYELGSFCVPSDNTAIYKNLLKSSNPVSLLLYGQPGSGKTEYAKALINSTGKKALVFKNEAEVIKKSDILGRLNCLLSLNKKDTVLIIDEADSLLATTVMTFLGPIQSSQSKGIVNKMLETSQNKVIWIVNRKSQMDESTLRRFTVSYKFEAMSPAMLESIAEKKLDTLMVSDETKKNILNMLSRYKVTGASVDNMVKAINSMNKRNEKTLMKNVEIVLKDNSELLYGKSALRENVSFAYDLSVLNTSIPAERVMTMLKNAKKFADKNPGTGAIRMLFFGLSGSGKTEFARFIGQTLGKKILLKRASDIFDKYVGGTEENIAQAFSEAAANDQILLFDEADSFFADRNQARTNYERTQVNEFLTQLEEFPGIVICTTNLRNIMDAAMLRRFHITVDFKALTEDGIKTLLEKYFSDYKFDDNLIGKLSAYNSVTPGDFGRLCGTIRFLSPEEITSEYIIEELCNIQKEKKEADDGISNKIGFCA